jgi:predicted nucleotidyltransferase
MKQPTHTQGHIHELHAQADRMVRHVVREAPHVVAVLVTGGLARGTADHLSDIDMTVFVRREHIKAGIPALPDECLSPVAIVDRFVQCLEQWMDPRNDERIWTMTNRWEMSHAKILHDPQGEARRLLAKKLVFRPGELRALKQVARESMWLVRGVADSWVERGDLVAAHYCVDQGVDRLLDYLFLKNRQFIPHEKWKLWYVRRLPALPHDFDARLQPALLVREVSEAELRRRELALVPLIDEAYQLPNVRA